jgi:hypothetical protein
MGGACLFQITQSLYILLDLITWWFLSFDKRKEALDDYRTLPAQ